MRLDIFLKLSRLIPRRTLAQEFLKKGLVSVNGVSAKAAKEILVGDEIEIRRYDKVTKARVLIVPNGKQVSKKDSSTLAEIISETKLETGIT
ncbi:MAG: S4 domain-containing protein [Pyrinomonadaceae bacterium]